MRAHKRTVLALAVAGAQLAPLAATAEPVWPMSHKVIRASCLKSCAKSEEHRRFCADFCDCTVRQLRWKGSRTPVQERLAADQEADYVLLACIDAARYWNIVVPRASCAPAIAEPIIAKVKAAATSAAVGKLFGELGDRAARAARHKDAATACPR